MKTGIWSFLVALPQHPACGSLRREWACLSEFCKAIYALEGRGQRAGAQRLDPPDPDWTPPDLGTSPADPEGARALTPGCPWARCHVGSAKVLAPILTGTLFWKLGLAQPSSPGSAPRRPVPVCPSTPWERRLTRKQHARLVKPRCSLGDLVPQARAICFSSSPRPSNSPSPWGGFSASCHPGPASLSQRRMSGLTYQRGAPAGQSFRGAPVAEGEADLG